MVDGWSCLGNLRCWSYPPFSEGGLGRERSVWLQLPLTSSASRGRPRVPVISRARIWEKELPMERRKNKLEPPNIYAPVGHISHLESNDCNFTLLPGPHSSFSLGHISLFREVLLGNTVPA
jgi:hypothetical protein